MLRASLLALPKNPRRNHLRFYCMVTANFRSPSGASSRRAKNFVAHPQGGASRHCPGAQASCLLVVAARRRIFATTPPRPSPPPSTPRSTLRSPLSRRNVSWSFPTVYCEYPSAAPASKINCPLLLRPISRAKQSSTYRPLAPGSSSSSFRVWSRHCSFCF